MSYSLLFLLFVRHCSFSLLPLRRPSTPSSFPYTTLFRSWPLTTFAGIVGWSRRKVDSKIRRQEWSENVHYRYDPDGEIHINIREYCRWVESGPGSKRERRQSKSGSTGTVSAFGKRSTGNPPQLT